MRYVKERFAQCTASALALVLVLSGAMLFPCQALASDTFSAITSSDTTLSEPGGNGFVSRGSDSDILLGMFTRSLTNTTNDIYASYDGETLYNVASTYESMADKPYFANHYPQTCPSIMYHDGYFWCLSNWNRNDGKFWPLISYSDDLVHWTHPEGDAMLEGTHGIELDKLPTVNGKGMPDFDVVAPEWSKTANGDIYIVFSAGYYGEFHGYPTQDKMQAYTVKVTGLSAAALEPDLESSYFWPSGLTFEAETAKKLKFSSRNNSNYIDGQLFTDDGKDYLVIKKDGLTNQLYTTSNIENPKGWKLVNPSMTFGYEGASLVKFKGKYRLYTDGVLDTKPLGVRVTTSDKLKSKKAWDEPKSPLFLSTEDELCSTRHGTLIVLKKGTPEWTAAKTLLDNQQRRTGGVMYRLYNRQSGEHFYTASGTEAGSTKDAGWRYEGIGWFAPTKSNTKVYRLYSGTDHHYTTDYKERKALVKAGWKYEGVGWYSDDAKGVKLYRQFNPNVNPQAKRNNSGSHNYTTSAEERDALVAVGWKDEGVGWYGLK